MTKIVGVSDMVEDYLNSHQTKLEALPNKELTLLQNNFR